MNKKTTKNIKLFNPNASLIVNIMAFAIDITAAALFLIPAIPYIIEKVTYGNTDNYICSDGLIIASGAAFLASNLLTTHYIRDYYASEDEEFLGDVCDVPMEEC